MRNFDSLTQRLNRVMATEYIAVNEQNPVAERMEAASFAQLTYVMQQYSIFPKELVQLMERARRKAIAANWLEVAQELKENIAEEMGSGTEGVSHYLLLANGLEQGLGVPVKTTSPSAATHNLLEHMHRIFNQQAAYVFGATYAIEATSIPELTIVVKIIDIMLEGAVPSDLQYFFEMHLNEWEPEHEAGLRMTLAQYIQPEEFQAFEAGFRAVMGAMDAWWSDLAAEALRAFEIEATVA